MAAHWQNSQAGTVLQRADWAYTKLAADWMSTANSDRPPGRRRLAPESLQFQASMSARGTGGRAVHTRTGTHLHRFLWPRMRAASARCYLRCTPKDIAYCDGELTVTHARQHPRRCRTTHMCTRCQSTRRHYLSAMATLRTLSSEWDIPCLTKRNMGL